MGCLFYNELSGERPGYVLAMRIWAFFSKMLAAMVYPGQEDLGLFQQNVSRLVCPGHEEKRLQGRLGFDEWQYLINLSFC